MVQKKKKNNAILGSPNQRFIHSQTCLPPHTNTGIYIYTYTPIPYFSISIQTLPPFPPSPSKWYLSPSISLSLSLFIYFQCALLYRRIQRTISKAMKKFIPTRPPISRRHPKKASPMPNLTTGCPSPPPGKPSGGTPLFTMSPPWWARGCSACPLPCLSLDGLLFYAFVDR